MQENKIQESLRKIADYLRAEQANNWVESVMYIDAATVPVIKLKISLRQLMIQANLKFPANPKYEAIYD